MAIPTSNTGLCLLIFFGLVTCAEPLWAQEQPPAGPTASQLQQIMQAENARNVGRRLPAGILVHDATGKTVDLRDVLNGPVVLLKVAADCPPCEKMLDWVRENAANYRHDQHASIAVLVIGTTQTTKTSYLDGVVLLHTPDRLSSGFLGGHLTPAEFFFDGNLTLVARRSGYNEQDVMQILGFPHHE